MEELADKLGFAQTFPFLHRFLFLFFSSSVSLFYVSATALSRPWCKLPCVVIWREFDVWRYEFANFLKFANFSLPCEGRITKVFKIRKKITELTLIVTNSCGLISDKYDSGAFYMQKDGIQLG